MYAEKIFSNDRHPDSYRDAKPNLPARRQVLEERGSKVNVTGVSCPDPPAADRIKNDISLCKMDAIAKSKMNDLNLMKVKGGHSWPPMYVQIIL